MNIATVEKDIEVDAAHDGARLDRFLVDHIEGISRAELQRWIKQGEVRVNGKNAIPHQALKVCDRIHIEHQASAQHTPDALAAIQVLAEEKDFLIIAKPSGVLMHATPNSHEQTLADWLLAHYPELHGVGEDPTRPGIVHRLDRDVSGLLLVARTPDAFIYYKNLFQERAMEKVYIALAHGSVEEDGMIELPISRSQSNRRRMAARADGIGRPAITAYHILKRYPHLTLLEVKPKTGRMHQIRVHLNAIGHPIVGDRLYVKKASKATQLLRPFLHAHKLAFVDQEGKERAYTLAIPQELQEYLDTLDEKHENS